MIINEVNESVNFVDANNVVVGYDMGQSCCENARWWINASGKEDEPEATADDLAPYHFDPETFKGGDSPAGQLQGDEDQSVAFRLIADNRPPLWLTLANTHNGYYSHGFKVQVGGKTIWESSL